MPFLSHATAPPKGRLSIGFEAAFLLVAPLIYLYFANTGLDREKSEELMRYILRERDRHDGDGA